MELVCDLGWKSRLLGFVFCLLDFEWNTLLSSFTMVTANDLPTLCDCPISSVFSLWLIFVFNFFAPPGTQQVNEVLLWFVVWCVDLSRALVSSHEVLCVRVFVGRCQTSICGTQCYFYFIHSFLIHAALEFDRIAPEFFVIATRHQAISSPFSSLLSAANLYLLYQLVYVIVCDLLLVI